MMQLWQWIRGRSGQAAVLSLFALSSIAEGNVGNLPRPQRTGGAIVDIALGIALLIPSVVTALVAARLLTLVTGVFPSAPIPPVNIEPGDAPGLSFEVQLALNLFSAVVIAPIGEELLYRGVIAQAWGRQSGPRRAIVFSALLFAFAHTLNLGGTTISEGLLIAIVAFLIRLPLGLTLGWLWVRRRSLLATIMLHAVYNIAIVLISS